MSTSAKDRIIIFDTTLRDGEQSPGCSMYLEEKLRMAELLDRMGVDVIEAGFPIASQGDFESVNEVAKLVKNAAVAGLCRAKTADIEAAAEALKPAKRRRIHTFISTSPLHMKHKLQMPPEDVLDAVTQSVTTARKFTDDVEWSAEDATRTEDDFLCRCVEAAIKAGATTINIPDTVGYTVPEDYAAIFTMLLARVPDIDKAILSVHCHNDLGLAVANSMAGIKAGARQAECTINGIGERAGNAAMEEMVMAMRTRPDAYPFETGIDTTMIMSASRTLSRITGFAVQPNKAIVGANAFAHEAGIHQHGVLMEKTTYEIMTPESIGLTQNRLVLGKHSGRHAFGQRLTELGYDLGKEDLDKAFVRFKTLADKKKDIYDEDLDAIVADEIVRIEERYRLLEMNVASGSFAAPTATVAMEVDGKRKKTAVMANGPVDATFKAIKKLTGSQATLKDFTIGAITGGTDAQGECTVRLQHDGREVLGQGAHSDIIVASAKAYINALNKLASVLQRTSGGL